jgi:hypothetical protein
MHNKVANPKPYKFQEKISTRDGNLRTTRFVLS